MINEMIQTMSVQLKRHIYKKFVRVTIHYEVIF